MPAINKKTRKKTSMTDRIPVDKNMEPINPNDPFLKKKLEDAIEFVRKHPLPERPGKK